MSQYPKINSLWKRQGWYFGQDKRAMPDYYKARQSFVIGDYASPEFSNVKYWHVTEKVDGTNIRIIVWKTPQGNLIHFGGRTDKATIPELLAEHLSKTFTADKIIEAIDFGTSLAAIIYGEGYGHNIQAAGPYYRSDPAFILFDVIVGNHWLDRESVVDIATKLNVPVVPSIGVMTEEEIVSYVKSKPSSLCSAKPQVMEGIIARANPALYFKDGRPITFKLKCKEFVDEKEQVGEGKEDREIESNT
jgi:ATP-dependent RNA circularization protein (DNA/RNA ligase family)